MSGRIWKVGKLAAATGASVRTLHYYDQIGLLKPSHRTASGHRLYAEADVARLQRIKSLQHLGFALDEIGELLDSDEFSPRRLLDAQIERLRTQIEHQQALCQRLESIASHMEHRRDVPVEEFLTVIKEMEMLDEIKKYYSDDQRAFLEERAGQVGDQRIKQAEKEWPQLLKNIQEEMAGGTDPTSPKVVAMVKRHQQFIAEFTGGDPGVTRSLGRLYKDRGSQVARHYQFPYSEALMEYMGKAAAAIDQSS